MDELEAILRIENHMRVHGIGEYPHIKIAEALLLAIAALKRPQVVRCKDCKHRSDALDCGNYLCNRKMLGMVRPNDFCSFGERRTDA